VAFTEILNIFLLFIKNLLLLVVHMRVVGVWVLVGHIHFIKSQNVRRGVLNGCICVWCGWLHVSRFHLDSTQLISSHFVFIFVSAFVFPPLFCIFFGCCLGACQGCHSTALRNDWHNGGRPGTSLHLASPAVGFCEQGNTAYRI